MKKVFYSWQSDTATNRNYIEQCLEGAIDGNREWEIETATRNTRGAADITPTILNKIKESNLFLADISIINPQASSAERKTPNPNVLYELGYAMAIVGQDNIILIANKTTTLDTNVLPFDIRNRRIMLVNFDKNNKQSIVNSLKSILISHKEPVPLQQTPIVTLLSNTGGWANWGGNNQGSGFRYHLKIDNYGGEIDYITNVRMIASNDTVTTTWQTRHFVFDTLLPNQALKLEQDEIKEIGVFLTDEPGQRQRMLPLLDTDIVKLEIELRSGTNQTIDIPPSRLKYK